MSLKRPAETRTASGQVLQTWADIAPHWRASIEPVTLRTQERLAGRTLQQDMTHVVRMRPYRGLKAKDRIYWVDDGDERILEISSIADIAERGELMELLCREVV